MSKTILLLSASLFSTSLMATAFSTEDKDEKTTEDKGEKTPPPSVALATQGEEAVPEEAPRKRPALQRQEAFSGMSRDLRATLKSIRAKKESSSTSS